MQNNNPNLKIVKGSKHKHIDFIKKQASQLVPYATWYYQNFLQLFDKQTHYTLVLELNSKPIAFCSFILTFPVADVDLTATKAEFQNQGYGSLLFKYGIKHLKKSGFTSVILEVAQNNLAGQKFYQKLGFKKQSRVLKNYYNDNQDAYIYMLEL